MAALLKAAAAPPQRGLRLTVAVDAAAMAVMLVCAGLALAPSYGGWRWLLALVAGVVIGLAAGFVPVLAKWPAIASVAIGIVGYLLVGPTVATPRSAVAGFVPGPESLRLLALGVVSGWKQVLTVADPVGFGGGLLIPAMLIGLIPAVAAAVIAGRSRRPLWALVAPATVLVAAAAFGTSHAYHPEIAGMAVAVVALAWGSWRTGGMGSGGLDVRRPLVLGAVVVVAVAGGLVLAPQAAPAASRTALRQIVQPQFDPQDYPSPLSAFRRYVKTDEKTKMITVTGLPAGGRIRIATMDAYNGLFYNVSTDSGQFTSVGDTVRTQEKGTTATLTVKVDGYTGVWLPDLGSLTGIAFDGPRASDLSTSLRYSKATGTAVVVAGLKQGDKYRLTSVTTAVPDHKALEAAGIGSAPLGRASRVPASLASAAATLTDGKETAFDKVDAIRAALVDRGLFSHGGNSALRSPSGHGYDRLQRLLSDKKMVGDQEQFAPTMALMVQSLGIPARVVLGFAPTKNDGKGVLTLTGADVSAWVEVDFAGIGWVAFDPTPDKSKSEQKSSTKPDTAPQRRLHQPPPPPRVAENADASDVGSSDAKDNQKKDDSKKDAERRGVPWVLAAGVGGPTLVVVVPIGLIVLLKLRRRKRWRSGAAARQVAGGWEWLLDGAVDLRAPVGLRQTRLETAAALSSHFGSDVATLARDADRRVFGPGEPAADDVAAYWDQVDAARAAMRKSVSPWRRLRASISTGSLRRRSSR